jgi:hypothetical protein
MFWGRLKILEGALVSDFLSFSLLIITLLIRLLRKLPVIVVNMVEAN